MKNLRIAVCQIECHPALYLGYTTPLEEPFLTKPDSASLAILSTKGLDVSSLQKICIQKYIEWSKERFISIIDFFNKFNPIPDLILFPEGSVPLPCLPIIYEWCAVTGATVMAGTHTPRLGRSGRKYYDDLNLSRSAIRKIHKHANTNMLPLIRGTKTVLIPKELRSVFERSEVSSPDPTLPTLKPYSFDKEGNRINLLPLICSEALKLHNVEDSYDLVAISAYDPKPDQFLSFIDQQTRNQKVVVFCNDGRFGGSFIFTSKDTRSPEWIYQAIPTGLPKGDSILIADIDLEASAVQVGTANPNRQLKLVTLASITYEKSAHSPVSNELVNIHQHEEPGVRAFELQQLLNQKRANSLQQIRLDQLQKLDSRGVPSSEYWDALGKDCLIKEQPRLKDLERRLASTCHETIDDILKSDSAKQPDVAPILIEFFSECGKRARHRTEPFFLSPDIHKTIINRETEVKRVHSSIDDRNHAILEIVGLEQIGKSAIILKALAQSGINKIIHVKLTATSSIDYILYSIIKQGGGDLKPPYRDPINIVKSVHVVNAIRSTRVLYIESGHELLDHRAWRDDLMPRVIVEIINIAEDTGTTIIYESRSRLNMDVPNPFSRAYLGVKGLDKKQLEHGVSLFESQLRRNNLSARSVPDEDKQFIVSRLGGHPIAIALAADVVFAEGHQGLLETLKQKKGFYLNYVSKLVRGLNLSKEETQVLKLVGLARGPVPRGAILSSTDFSSGLVISNLINCGALEVDNLGLIQLPGILTDYFNPDKLPDSQIQKFHENAANLFQALAEDDYKNLWASIEAEFHSALAGIKITFDSLFVDGAIATAKEFYNKQQYVEARKIVQPLLKRRQTQDILRLAALVEARTNHLDEAIKLAKQVFSRFPKDTWLLSELTNIAIKQYQADEIAEDLISIARKAGIEDVFLLITEGKLLRRQQRTFEAERVFERAVQITTLNPWPFYYVGQMYYQHGYLEDAINILKDGEEFCYEKNSKNKNAYNAIRTLMGVVYLFNGQIDLAEPIIDSLYEEEPTRPEIARAHAALTIHRDGIKKAHIAINRLVEANKDSSGYSTERCQTHILTGLFYEGINDNHKAGDEFEKAHYCDKSNVFILMKVSKINYGIGESLWKNQNDSYDFYFQKCASYVRKILNFDSNNDTALYLMEKLNRVGISI